MPAPQEDSELHTTRRNRPRKKWWEHLYDQAPRKRFQFRLLTLFVLTTVFAVASAGFAKGSVKGAIGALFGAWTTLIGCALVWGGVRERSLLGVAVGAGYVVLGVSLWLISVF